MSRWVVLLRGVNVGGHGKLPMADLREELSKAGFDEVRTHIQSGNVVLSSDLGADGLRKQIGDTIETKFGFRPDVLVRTSEVFAQGLGGIPFSIEGIEPKFVHLYFHDGDEASVDMTRVRSLVVDETFAAGEGVFYLVAPNGFSKSKLAEKFATCVRVPVTARNLNTCRKIADLVSAR